MVFYSLLLRIVSKLIYNMEDFYVINFTILCSYTVTSNYTRRSSLIILQYYTYDLLYLQMAPWNFYYQRVQN